MDRVVPLWVILAQVRCTITIFFLPIETKEKSGPPPKIDLRGGWDGFSEPGYCHPARGCSTETTEEAAVGVKSLLMTTKSNCGIFNFILFF